jgi:hypothetical protein
MANGDTEGESKGATSSPRPRIRLSPVGFWSYTRRDDDFARGRLSRLRSLVLAEIQTQYGRDDVQLFQDVGAIPDGSDWERLTTDAIGQASFFIPIVTPNYVQSPWCARETKMFVTRVDEMFETYPDLPRDRLRMFPLLWIPVEDVEPVDEEAAAALGVPQWSDFTKLRHRNLEHDEEVLAKIAKFAKNIVDVLKLRVEAPLSDAERKRLAREAAAAERRARKERDRREAEARETERLRAVDAEHLAAEEAERVAAQAEQDRLAAEERKREEAARAEYARKLEAERRKADEERAAERRARREADLALVVPLLRRPALWLVAGAAVVLFLLALWAMRSSDTAEHNVAIPANEMEAAADEVRNAGDGMAANIADDAAANTALPAQPPAIDWLLGPWGVNGNCRDRVRIYGNRERLIVETTGERPQTLTVQEVGADTITTNVAI